MKNVNLNAIKEHVSTQYGDLTGVIQIDGHENITSIYELCKDFNFETNNKFIIGFGLSESTIDGIGKRDNVYCTILYVLKEEYGTNFEEIQNQIQQNGVLKLKKKNISIPYSKVGKYIKRFDFMVTSELTNSANKIEIEDE